MYNLADFSLHDMAVCSSKLRAFSVSAAGFDEAAHRLVTYLYDHLVDGDTGKQACALVRLFTTQAYCDLSTDRRAWAEKALGEEPAAPGLKCLTISATAGERPEWNDRHHAERYHAIPLVSNERVSQFPLFSELFIQLGVNLDTMLRPGPERFAEADERPCNVFYVADAIGSPFVPDQHDFVLPYGVRSVLGFGALLPSGNLFVVVLFTKVFVPRRTADLFKPLALSTKLALLPFDGPSIVPDPSDAEPTNYAGSRRGDSRGAALEQLLILHEEAVMDYTANEEYADEALQDSKAPLTAFMDATKDIVLLLDRLGTIRSWHEAAQVQFGYSAREARGQPVDMILTAGFRAAFEHAIQVAGTTAPSQAAGITFTSVGRRKNGTSFPLEVSLMTWKSPRTLTLLATMRNISERTSVEAALAKSESHLRTLVDHAPDAIFTLSPDGMITSLNPMFETMTQWPRAGWVGKPFTMLVHSDDVTTARESIAYIVQKRCPITCILRMRSRERSDLMGEFMGTPLIDEGQVTGVLGFVRDITERKTIEQALRQSEEQLRSVVQFTQDAIIALDCHGTVVFWNAGAERIFGYAAEEMLNQPATCIMPERFRAAHHRGIERAAAAGRLTVSSTMFELIGLRKDGSEFPLEFTLASWKTKSGLFFTGIIRDITERKRADDAMTALLHGTASVTGEKFFPAFVQQLAAALEVPYAYVTERVDDMPPARRILASWLGGREGQPFEHEAVTMLCETAIQSGSPYYTDRVQELCPDDAYLRAHGVTTCLGVPMVGSAGNIIGHVCVMDVGPWKSEQHATKLMTIFAARAAAEVERLRATAALRQSEARQALILNTLPIAFYTARVSADFPATWVSNNLERLTGYPPRVFVDSPQFWMSHVHPDDRARVLAEVERGRGDGTVSMEYRWQIADGSYRWFLDNAVYTHDAHGRTTELIGAWIDITERKEIEHALRESEERLRLTLSATSLGIWDWDITADRVVWTDAVAAILGLHPMSTATFEFYLTLVHPEDRQRVVDAVTRSVETSVPYAIENRILWPDGSVHWVACKGEVLRDGNGKAVRMLGTVQDVTERKHHEAELRTVLARVRTLSGRLEVVREEERGRIARELHDEFGVGLTCLKIDLSRLTALIGKTAELEKGHPIEEKIRAMGEFIDTTIVGVQRIVSELRPAILDDLGLVAAIEWQSHDFERRTGIACALHTDEDDLAVEPGRATAVFRICQEALTNVARHADATAVTIRLEQHHGMLMLEVKDNGRGIPHEKILYPHSLGLLGMRERAELFGGAVTIVGHPNAGTTVTLHLHAAQTPTVEGSC